MPLKPHHIILFYLWKARYFFAVISLFLLGYLTGYQEGRLAHIKTVINEAKRRDAEVQAAVLAAADALSSYAKYRAEFLAPTNSSTGSLPGEPESSSP